MTREELEQIPAGTELLRRVRFLHDEDFVDVTADEIALAARWLHAASYSALEGARRLEAIHRNRTTTTEQEPER